MSRQNCIFLLIFSWMFNAWMFNAAMSLELQNAPEPTSSYTFNVLRDGATCTSASQQHEDATSLQTLITNQYSLLEQQLNILMDKFVQLEERRGNDQRENESVATNVGTTYVRWGRTSCRETATNVYEGKKD